MQPNIPVYLSAAALARRASVNRTVVTRLVASQLIPVAAWTEEGEATRLPLFSPDAALDVVRNARPQKRVTGA